MKFILVIDQEDGDFAFLNKEAIKKFLPIYMNDVPRQQARVRIVAMDGSEYFFEEGAGKFYSEIGLKFPLFTKMYMYMMAQ